MEITRESLAEWLAKTGLDGKADPLALAIELEGIVIGDVAFVSPTKSTARARSSGFSPAHGGQQGFATEAVRTVLSLGLDHYHLHRITAQTKTRNSASAVTSGLVG